MGKKSGGPRPPDYSALIAQQNELSRQSLDFYKSVYYNDLAPRQARYDQLLEGQVSRQNAISDFGFRQAQEDRQRYLQDFVPIEASLVAESMGLDPGPAVRAAQQKLFEDAASTATADVNQAYAGAEGALSRGMSRMGVNPNSGNFGANATQLALQRARDLAFGANNARRQAETTSWAKRADVANMGRGLGSGNVAAASLGLNAANAAAGTGGMGLAGARANTSVMGQGFGQASQFGMNAGSLMNSQFRNQLAADEAGGDPFGTILGTGLGVFTGGLAGGLGSGLAKSFFQK